MKRLNLLAGCLVVLCGLLSSCATASFSKYKGVGRVKRYDFYSAQLPDSFDGFRVAFASDFHYESRFTARRLPGMCQALRSLDADVLLLGTTIIIRFCRATAIASRPPARPTA